MNGRIIVHIWNTYHRCFWTKMAQQLSSPSQRCLARTFPLVGHAARANVSVESAQLNLVQQKGFSFTCRWKVNPKQSAYWCILNKEMCFCSERSANKPDKATNKNHALVAFVKACFLGGARHVSGPRQQVHVPASAYVKLCFRAPCGRLPRQLLRNGDWPGER